MGKAIKSPVIDQVMNELSEEIQSSPGVSSPFGSSPELLAPDLTDPSPKESSSPSPPRSTPQQSADENRILPFIPRQRATMDFPEQKPVRSSRAVPTHITLQQSENLRLAQERITELESELERLRVENEELIAAGDIFKERLNKVMIRNNDLKEVYEESRKEFQDEKRTLTDTLRDQSREMDKLSVKNQELEKRLVSNIQQIRVRERELENRLELMKLDNQTLVREKDQYILDLKREIDKMKMDFDSQKNKHEEILRKLESYRSQNRRVTQGLQVILGISKGNKFIYDSVESQTQADIQAQPSTQELAEDLQGQKEPPSSQEEEAPLEDPPDDSTEE